MHKYSVYACIHYTCIHAYVAAFEFHHTCLRGPNFGSNPLVRTSRKLCQPCIRVVRFPNPLATWHSWQLGNLTSIREEVCQGRASFVEVKRVNQYKVDVVQILSGTFLLRPLSQSWKRWQCPKVKVKVAKTTQNSRVVSFSSHCSICNIWHQRPQVGTSLFWRGGWMEGKHTCHLSVMSWVWSKCSSVKLSVKLDTQRRAVAQI